MLQCVAIHPRLCSDVRCVRSVFYCGAQCDAVHCSVLHLRPRLCSAVRSSLSRCCVVRSGLSLRVFVASAVPAALGLESLLRRQCSALCCIVLHCFALCCIVLHCVAVCCSGWCVAVCCSGWCVAVCCTFARGCVAPCARASVVVVSAVWYSVLNWSMSCSGLHLCLRLCSFIYIYICTHTNNHEFFRSM